MHQYTNAFGEVVTLPEINHKIAKRLKRWDVCDLGAVITDPNLWESFFGRLTSDFEFIVAMAYGVLNSELGDDRHQEAFEDSLCGHGRGSGPLIELGDALREAVIDFFPALTRDAIRQFWLMTVTATAVSTFQNVCPDINSTESDLPTRGNGSNTCSESSTMTGATSVGGKSANDSTGEPTMTDFSPHPSLQDYLMQMED